MLRLFKRLSDNPFTFWLCVVIFSLIIIAPNCRREQPLSPTDKTERQRSQPPKLSPKELAQGWLLLFDGESLFGWTTESKTNWQVKDYTISVSESAPGLLRTTTEFSDFELRLQFRADARANGGVLLRTTDDPKDVGADCYEVNIAPADNPYPTGSLVKRKAQRTNYKPGRWTTLGVKAQGGLICVEIDGEKVLEYTDTRPVGRGAVALEYITGRIDFRDIRIRPLGLESIFNGKDLTGWRTHPELTIDSAVTEDRELHVTNGRGQLETEKAYGDFVLRFDCRTNAKGLNSGVFFRCIPNDIMNGYECQIDNRFADNDRTAPTDCGTGGIFRRADVRKVIPNDLEWFTTTLIATGPHMAVWVNGIQVTDFTDTRAPNVNPRRGLRTEPGTIMLQGHDATTDVSFRAIEIRETPTRETDDSE